MDLYDGERSSLVFQFKYNFDDAAMTAQTRDQRKTHASIPESVRNKIHGFVLTYQAVFRIRLRYY